MSELDRLWCTLRDAQERCTELEQRVSLLESRRKSLEDWPGDEEVSFEDRQEEEDFWAHQEAVNYDTDS